MPVDSFEAIEKRRHQAIADTLNASNIVIRTLAASKLQNQPNMCAEYQFSYTDTTLFVQCDQHPRIAVHLDGQPTQYPKKDGTFFAVVAEVNGNTITQHFPFDNGTLKVIYRIDPNQFWVQKAIYSSYLGMPLIVEGTYQPK